MARGRSIAAAAFLIALGFCCFGVVRAQSPAANWQTQWRAAFDQKEYQRAVQIAREASQRGDPEGKHALAWMLRNGLGTGRDMAEARRLFGEAASAGRVASANEFGKMLWRGEGGSVDLDGAYLAFTQAADRGHPESMYNLSLLLADSRFGRRDPIAAFATMHRAAVAGYVPAYARVGMMIGRGDGVTRDPEKAVDWYRHGAERSDVQSIASLGHAMAVGAGTPRNPQEGERLLVAAANAGSRWAMQALTDLYNKGEALRRDYVKAYFWGTLAMAQGQAPAFIRATVDDLEKKISQDQIAGVQRQVQQWAPKSIAASGSASNERSSQQRSGSGSGFFVSPDGHALTNHHVIDKCARVTTPAHGEVTVVFQDPKSDLALVRTQTRPTAWARFRNDPARLGESVYVFGYPLYGLLSTEGNFTTGVVSAMTGLGNNAGNLQITAPIQPGNSGGPVVDESGRVVGVAVAVLRSNVLGQEVVPQNVNFIVGGSLALNVLQANGIKPDVSPPAGALNTGDLAQQLKRISTVLICQRQ